MTTALIEASNLTPKQDAFAIAFVETGDATAAYKAAYDTSGMQPATIKRSAWDVRHNAKVAARIHALRGAIASTFVLSEASLKAGGIRAGRSLTPRCSNTCGSTCCSMCHSEEQLARDMTRYLTSLGTTAPLEPPSAFTPDDDPFSPPNPRCES